MRKSHIVLAGAILVGLVGCGSQGSGGEGPLGFPSPLKTAQMSDRAQYEYGYELGVSMLRKARLRALGAADAAYACEPVRRDSVVSAEGCEQAATGHTSQSYKYTP